MGSVRSVVETEWSITAKVRSGRRDLCGFGAETGKSLGRGALVNDAKLQFDALEKNCRESGVRLFDMNSKNQGIVHIIGPELGITQPGQTLVCGDSHTSTHGAFGTLAFRHRHQ